jgi:hypothetical protein
MFCRSFFVHLTIFFWPLCCLSIYDLRLPIAPFDIFNFSFSLWFDPNGTGTHKLLLPK